MKQKIPYDAPLLPPVSSITDHVSDFLVKFSREINLFAALYSYAQWSTSPRLRYSPPGAWSDADPNDPFLAEYYSGNYRSTNSSAGRGRVSITWEGSSIWIYGGYRNRLGPYQVTLDGVSEKFPGFTPGQAESVQYVLFGRRGLDHSLTHSVELVNLGDDDQVLDLDFIVLQHDQHHINEARYVDPTVKLPMQDNPQSRSTPKTPTIVGATVISVLVVIIGCMCFWWRRQRRIKKAAARELIPDPFPMSQHQYQLPLHSSPATPTSGLSRKSSTNPSTFGHSSRSHLSRNHSTHNPRSPLSPVASARSPTSTPRHTIRKAASNPTLNSYRTHSPQLLASPPTAVIGTHHHHQHGHQHQLGRYPFSDDGHAIRAARDHLRRSRSAMVHWTPTTHHQYGLAGDHRRQRSGRRPPSVVI